MIIFKAFQGLENFYIKLNDLHTFSGSVRTLYTQVAQHIIAIMIIHGST